MNPEPLRNELKRDPWVPLRFHLADSRHFDVQNPGLCFISKLSLYVFAAKPRDFLAEDVQLISLRGINLVEQITPSQAA